MAAARELVGRLVHVRRRDEDATLADDLQQRADGVARDGAVFEHARRGAAAEAAVEDAEQRAGPGPPEPRDDLLHQYCGAVKVRGVGVVSYQPVVVRPVAREGDDDGVVGAGCAEGLVEGAAYPQDGGLGVYDQGGRNIRNRIRERRPQGGRVPPPSTSISTGT